MNIRTCLEEKEEKFLSPYACRSSRSAGRENAEEPCSIRTIFQHDRDRILHCKSFRRLKHKTQVFLSPEGDHYRTRLTHTLEVAQIARTIARGLALNEDLAEAIALGHDLGHTPFGHAGEGVLNELVPGGFRHVDQSLRVVDVLEKEGAGLNLSFEVRDGIRKHSKGMGPLVGEGPDVRAVTLEGRIVRLADIIAYLNHDLDDAIRAGLVSLDQVPAAIRRTLGDSHSRRIDTMVRDMIGASLEAEGSEIRLSPEVAEAIEAMRDWLFHQVYRVAGVHDEFTKASGVVRQIFYFFRERPQLLPVYGGRVRAGDAVEVSIADFIAGMTDRYALNLYQRLFLPQPWKIL